MPVSVLVIDSDISNWDIPLWTKKGQYDLLKLILSITDVIGILRVLGFSHRLFSSHPKITDVFYLFFTYTNMTFWLRATKVCFLGYQLKNDWHSHLEEIVVGGCIGLGVLEQQSGCIFLLLLDFLCT